MNWNWEAIGATGEIAGALAVVVSLLYLAKQVTTSNRLARAEAFRTPNSDLNSLNSSFGTDETFRGLFARVVHDRAQRADFSPSEWILLDSYVISITNLYEQLYREIREGILNEEVLDDFGARLLFELPYYRSSWSFYKASLGRSFVEYFESRFNLQSESG